MARWEPHTRERLVHAALDLFTEQGYDATTVNQIAERAGGLTKMTFFRHFPDDRRDFAVRLGAVIAGNSELRERAAFKRTGLTEAVREALEKRGVPDLTASLAAELGIRAFYRAFDQWADPASQQTLTDRTRHAFDELRAATAALN